LRERVLRALDRGGRPTEIARRFEVSRMWVYQVRDRSKRRRAQQFSDRGHRRSRVAEREQVLRAWIAAQPDLTLAELQQRLARQGVSIKIGALLAPAEQMESDLQKKPCTPASKSAKTCRRRGAHGVKRSPGWTSKSWCLSMKPGHRPA